MNEQNMLLNQHVDQTQRIVAVSAMIFGFT